MEVYREDQQKSVDVFFIAGTPGALGGRLSGPRDTKTQEDYTGPRPAQFQCVPRRYCSDFCKHNLQTGAQTSTRMVCI